MVYNKKLLRPSSQFYYKIIKSNQNNWIWIQQLTETDII